MQTQADFKINEQSSNYGEFVIEPLARGYGVTLGNPLRRILLSSISGTAVTSVYIEDVLHEFSTVKGVKEDMMQIILNFKGLVVRLPDDEPATLTLRSEGAGVVTAGDLEAPVGVEVVNPDMHIATLSEEARLVMEVRVERGLGYVPAEVHGTKDRINSIPVDAIFTPVRRVAYRVEDTRVGQETDLDRLIFRIWTDGSISPRQALDSAVAVMREQLSVFSSYEPVEEEVITPATATFLEDSSSSSEDKPVVEIPPQIAGLTLENLDLSSRVLHSLQEEGIDSINALLALSEKELKKVGGIGEKSLGEIRERLTSHNLKLRA